MRNGYFQTFSTRLTTIRSKCADTIVSVSIFRCGVSLGVSNYLRLIEMILNTCGARHIARHGPLYKTASNIMV